MAFGGVADVLTITLLVFCVLRYTVAVNAYGSNMGGIMHDTTQYSTGNLQVPENIALGSFLSLSHTQRSDRDTLLCHDLATDSRIISDLPKPDYLYVGVAKGGSTSLSMYLRMYWATVHQWLTYVHSPSSEYHGSKSKRAKLLFFSFCIPLKPPKIPKHVSKRFVP